MAKSILKLQPSNQTQLETFGDEIDISQLLLYLKGQSPANIRESVLDGEIVRRIDGASYLSLTLNDSDRDIQRSGRLGAGVDINIDGLWFRLAKVRKDATDLSLQFEDREVAIMRTYEIKRKANRDKMNRAHFIRSLVREVRELRIPVKIPEIDVKQPIEKGSSATTGPDAKWNKYLTKERGLPPHPANTGHGGVPAGGDPKGNDKVLLVKGLPMSQEQLDVAEIILDVGVSQSARRKVLVTAIMVAIQESTLHNLPDGEGTSVGAFQIIDIHGTFKQRHDVAWSAAWFFRRAIPADKQHPDFTQNDLAQSVQRSGFPNAYGQWYYEANAIVSAYGIPATQQDAYQDNGMQFEPPADDTGTFEFSTYTLVRKGSRDIPKIDDLWVATGRLADEVNWRRFFVSGTFYYASEAWLFHQQKPRMRISEDTEGIDWIDYDYDVGKKTASVTVSCRITRWGAPPGSVVIIDDDSPVDGRWLVQEVRRPLFSTQGSVTLTKPRPKLKEPFSNVAGTGTSKWKFRDTNEKALPTKGGIVMPVQATEKPTVSQFLVVDAEGAPNRLGVKFHGALDWTAPDGSPVFAPEDGKIVEIKPTTTQVGQVFGGVVKVQTDTGRVWVFRHVEPIFALRLNGTVAAGSQVAAITLWLTNPKSSHVHIECWKTLAGGYKIENMLDPLEVLK